MNGGVFDYIIVGAGSAGCVLANRLTASGQYSVLLLEAGPRDTNPWIHVPLGYGKLFNDPRTNWLFKTTPQRELNDRSISQPRGKVLGGSSSINGLVYIRGQPEDFDDWRDRGNPGWGFEDLLPYFIRSEDHVLGAGAFHGESGPLGISAPTDPHPLCDAFIAAGQIHGHPRNDDFNGATQEGVGYYHTTSRKGVRCSTAAAYLKPASRRGNLRIETLAFVTRIVFDQRRARAVQWRRNGMSCVSAARREVLLCAGAINSPQLLELSGVGNGALLQRHGIVVVHDLPGVGESLQDHLQVRAVFRCTQKITLNDDMASPWRRLGIGLRYLLQRRGPLTVSAGYAGAFLRTEPSLTRPDVQVHFITFSTTNMGDALHPHSGFTASICQLRPQSRGSVHIRSADPADAPAIDPNYFSAETDRRATVAGLQTVRHIVHSEPLSAFVAEEVEPGSALQSFDEVLGYCRQHGASIYHPTCSARMGKDPGAVVDARLRVHGVTGLRVVDGSVMPSLVSGNSNAAIIAIGEKAADLILQDVDV